MTRARKTALAVTFGATLLYVAVCAVSATVTPREKPEDPAPQRVPVSTPTAGVLLAACSSAGVRGLVLMRDDARVGDVVLISGCATE